jgi:hypothetical protein
MNGYHGAMNTSVNSTNLRGEAALARSCTAKAVNSMDLSHHFDVETVLGQLCYASTAALKLTNNFLSTVSL